MVQTAAPDRVAVEELIQIYCDSWGEPDPARRRRAVERVWVEDGTYTDPSVHTSGRDELVAHIGNVLAKYPGARIVRTSAVDVHHGMLRFTWHMVLATGQALPDGIDFGELAGDGKLRRIVGFFGRLAKA
ncbi:MAG TPA: nuclear transport factor 2 family protein [Methylomirabilota bacterium]|nr:nuclear transport factor 2 family protein [Methylomirabilota bacterium]